MRLACSRCLMWVPLRNAKDGGLQRVGQVGLEPTRPMDSRF